MRRWHGMQEARRTTRTCSTAHDTQKSACRIALSAADGGSSPKGGSLKVRSAAEPAVLKPLEMIVQTESGASVGSLAYNEVSLLRQTRQAAHLSIDLNGQTRLEELICDGVLVATAAGSTAYNYSANGPILPFGSEIVALTPIAPFRPRRWRGALLRTETEVCFRVLDPYKRPVSATADSHEVRDVVEVTIQESRERTVTLLFDPEHNLEERILSEQFET